MYYSEKTTYTKRWYLVSYGGILRQRCAFFSHTFYEQTSSQLQLTFGSSKCEWIIETRFGMFTIVHEKPIK